VEPRSTCFTQADMTMVSNTMNDSVAAHCFFMVASVTDSSKKGPRESEGLFAFQ
jgi:hypothetical protein